MKIIEKAESLILRPQLYVIKEFYIICASTIGEPQTVVRPLLYYLLQSRITVWPQHVLYLCIGAVRTCFS